MEFLGMNAVHFLGNPKRKLWRINGQEDTRRGGLKGLCGLPEAPPKLRKVRQDIEPHHREFCVGEQGGEIAGLFHQGPPNSLDPQIFLGQRGENLASQKITRGLTSNHKKIRGRGHGLWLVHGFDPAIDSQRFIFRHC